MVMVGEVQVQVVGDIGGQGIARMRFTRQDTATITPADANAAGAAVHGFWNGASLYMASDIELIIQPNVETFDSASGLVSTPVHMGTAPGIVTGSVGGNYAAGVGARVNWKTGTIAGRRLIRGATYVVPCAGTGFSAGGQVSSANQNQLIGVCSSYLAAMATASLNPVIWHRPAKGATSGGLVGVITGYAVPTTPAGLRSRRS